MRFIIRISRCGVLPRGSCFFCWVNI